MLVSSAEMNVDLVENAYEWRSKERMEVVVELFVRLRLLDTV